MATAHLSVFLRRLTRGMVAETLADRSDRQLVEQFLARRDEAVFEALMRRHGPMVYRVCWRVLQQDQDTEDAFQATFLVLAQKLRAVRKQESLASWLHGVAHRVALKAKAQAALRRRHEQQAVGSQAVPPDEVSWGEVRAALDAELAQLPEKWRLPLLLCYLEGRTQDEAAGHLGWTRTTLQRRLAEARAALGRRLTRRGVVWPAALSAVLLSDCVAPAALAPRLVSSTVEAEACTANGQAAPTAVSARVAALTEGVVKTMVTSRLKIATAVLVLLAIVGVGAGGLVYQTQATKPPKSEPAKAQPGVPAKQPPGVPAVADRKPVVVREDAQVGRVAWSADGKVVATVNTSYEAVEVTDGDGKNPHNVHVPRSTVKVWDATTGQLIKSLGEEKEKDQETNLTAVAFSPDKKLVAILGRTGGGGKADGRKEPSRPFVKILDAETWAVKQELDEDDLRGVASAFAFSPDGQTLALGGGSPFAEKGSVVKLWDLQGQKMTTAAKFAAPPLAAGTPGEVKAPEWWWVECLAFSPDGKVLAAGEFSRGGQRPGVIAPDGKVTGGESVRDGKRVRIQLYDARTGEPKRAWEIGESKGMVDVAFTADGKRLLSASGAVKLWDADTGTELTTLETKGEEVFRFGPVAPNSLLEDKGVEVFRVAVSPDGWNLATSGLRKENDKSIHEVCVWQAKTGNLMKRVSWENPSMWASSIAFSRDGNLAIGAQTDADARVKGSEKVKGELQLIPLSR